MRDPKTYHQQSIADRGPVGRPFLVEAVRDMRTVGAVAPSGRRLARLLTAPVCEQAGRPLAVLEVGAGTGPVTRALIPVLGPGSHLDVVEVNPHFAARLRHLVHTHPHPAPVAGRVQVHQARIEEFTAGRRYDVIVSGLPFTNFTPAQVRAIMDRYLDLLWPGGALTYFAYLGTGTARRLLASRSEAARHRAVEHLLADYRRRYAVDRRTAWTNLPPARAWRLRVPPAPGQFPA